MNTEDLIKMWNQEDSNLEEVLKINQELLTTVSLQKVKSFLKPLERRNIFELVVNSLFLFWIVPFIAEHSTINYFLISGIFLFLMMLSGIISNIYNLYLAKSITFNTSIVETQQKIERLKLYERYSINTLYVVIPLAAVPFLLVLGKGFLGIDVYQIFGANNLWLFTFGSLIVGLIIVWFVKRFPDEEIEKANQFLTEINGFEEK